MKTKSYDWLTQSNKGRYEKLLDWQKDIIHIFDPRIFGIPEKNLLPFLYSHKKSENCKEVPVCRMLDHTMYAALDEYVQQKFPAQIIKKAIISGKTIEIHGIYPTHLQEVCEYLGFSDLQKIDFDHNPSQKMFNFVRPEFYFAKRDEKEILLVVVTPGRDYILHYASMIKHLIAIYTTKVDKILKVFRYPYVENSIHTWTNLNQDFFGQNDILIIGYVEEFNKYLLQSKVKCEYLSSHQNEFYQSRRFRIGKKVVNLLGVKYSFWGNISAKIVYQACRMGTSEVIYFGKLGILNSDKDIYQKIFSPTKFIVMYHDKVICNICDLQNKIAGFIPKIDTNYHVSVPTVLEEDYIQREITTELGIESIDNEIAQIAFAIKKFNVEFQKNIAFSPIHFATDFVRLMDKPDIETSFDLSNNRTIQAKLVKNKIIDQICQKILEYLKS